MKLAAFALPALALATAALSHASTDKSQLWETYGTNQGDPNSPLTANGPLLTSHLVPTPWNSLVTHTFGFGFKTDATLNQLVLEPVAWGAAVWTPDHDGDTAPKFLYVTVRIETAVFGPKGSSARVKPKTLEKLPYGAAYIGMPDLKDFEFNGEQAAKEKFQEVGFVTCKATMALNGIAFAPGSYVGEFTLPRMSMNISGGATGELRYTITNISDTPPLAGSQ